MESETLITDYPRTTRQRVLAAVGPVLWIAVSYVDPGKWAAAVEGGARFGSDLILLVLIINCATILCQYLSARVAIATGKDLSQICSEEYDDLTCILLGIQAEISMVMLDLTMPMELCFLTGFDAVLFPFLASFLENTKAKIIFISLVCFILASYVSGVIVSQPESALSMGGMLNKLTGENAYALMISLEQILCPHNFTSILSLVQQDQGQTKVSKGALCHDHFFSTFCAFSGTFAVNCVLMNLAANVFYSSGFISLTLQDALSLLDQGFRSSLASIALVSIMFLSNQLVATSSHGRQASLAHDLFRLEIPGWLHRAAIRIIAIILALFCVRNSGAGDLFQLLIFTQVVVALLLPSSVIPLFKVASSRLIMGAYKISHLVEIPSFSLLCGNAGAKYHVSHRIAAFTSLCLMLWLATTPLKSASSGLDTQTLKWDKKASMIESSVEKDPMEISEIQHQLEKSMEKQEPVLSLEKSFGSHQDLSTPTPDLSLPEAHVDSEINLDLNALQENKSEITSSEPAMVNREASAIISEIGLPESGDGDKSESLDDITVSTESKDMMEKTLKIEGDVQNEKDDEGDPWEPEESTRDVSESIQSLTSEGPGSFRSVSGKIDDVGSGAGSLSRLAGLGRAARRQLTAVLDEFWGQMFDFHGQATHEAKAKKLDVLLGVDSRVDSKSSFASVKLESINKESTGYIPSTSGRGSDLLRTSSF
ncbi:UNVERIFIED_CONTAM: Ethylene-insensitive protein 2 [Sesamum angustifolium]|uniref:Ethylene-insensitive protein 2 n=1 Tax=Sesamum angustifolium TaxID=2727405 RepID=A0AAW2N7M2_9LAMI